VHGFTPISIAGALTSLLVSPLLIFLMLRARRRGRFETLPFVGLLLFETGFLVAYMTFLSFAPARQGVEVDAADAWLGAIHGIAALVVFMGFWCLVPWARRAYARGVNLFARRPGLTGAAIGARVVALVSGELIFLLHWVR
jgi:hypothetical protein